MVADPICVLVIITNWLLDISMLHSSVGLMITLVVMMRSRIILFQYISVDLVVCTYMYKRACVGFINNDVGNVWRWC